MQNHCQGQCHIFESPAVLPVVYSEFVFCRSHKKKHGSIIDEADKAVAEFLKCKYFAKCECSLTFLFVIFAGAVTLKLRNNVNAKSEYF
jgi:hypothetical protein